ncbi:hypothetical protein SKAU_G00233030 [Synaphobranchus kaupii]|uniref:C-type lectin domain-containing protein n=1 Tax=Synaphobranchus kaupii TaxID=118154 RepID=A0A9Q1F5Z2_SYNKA|nr:hypothetical protein SKAU_G00233030 [Synaphobranchus kaupii]
MSISIGVLEWLLLHINGEYSLHSVLWQFMPSCPECEMESNNNGNTEIAFSHLDQEEFFSKETRPWSSTLSASVPHRWSQVLLVVLCFALLCGLIGLGVHYAEKSNMSNSLEAKNKNISASMFSLQRELAAYRDSREYDGVWRSHLGQSYFFSSEKMNWMQSHYYCISRGDKLVIIKSAQKQRFLVTSISETHWIGLSDRGTEEQWHWVDETPLSETEPQFWYTRADGMHEPDNWTEGGDPHGEDCAAMGDEHGALNQWFDASCKKEKKFVCEK